MEAERQGDLIILTVRVPEPALRDGYRLMLRGSKGHFRRELTGRDVIDRPEPGTVRYRWRPDPREGWSNHWRGILHSGMHTVVDYFVVPEAPDPAS